MLYLYLSEVAVQVCRISIHNSSIFLQVQVLQICVICMMCLSIFPFQVVFGVLMFVYVPYLDPHPGHTPVRTMSVDSNEYEELPGGEYVCPERHVTIFSSKYLPIITG